VKPDESRPQAEAQPDGGDTAPDGAADMERAQQRAAKEREGERGYQ
jgi:hypothetical protein